MSKQKFNPKLNPHTYQNSECEYKDSFKRILTDDFPSDMKYRPRRPNEDRSTVHYGQRKLHLSEIEFLTNYCKSLSETDSQSLSEHEIVLIYAGAAPGIHISKLSEMFPFVKFVLVDPAPFIVKSTDKIEIIQDFFTDKMAEKMRETYRGYRRLFVSDIRLFGPDSIDEDQLEEKVENDMVAQKRWYSILEPTRSMLKFRPPYIGDNFNRKTTIEYLDGDVYFQIWPAGSSSETRLVVCGKNAKIKDYDSIKYENQMFKFNQVDRVSCYEHSINVSGLDHCYDCRAEVYVFEEYVKIKDILKRLSKLYGNKIKIQSVEEYIEELNEILNARQKKCRITKNGNNYDVYFTDIKYGQDFHDLCNERTLTREPRQSYFNNKFTKRLKKNDSTVSNKWVKNLSMEKSLKYKKDFFSSQFGDQVIFKQKSVKNEHISNRLTWPSKETKSDDKNVSEEASKSTLKRKICEINENEQEE